MIAIIDYGVGNLKSVQKALTYLGIDSVITSDAETILKAEKVILPGVGAFGDAMKELKNSTLDKIVYQVVEKQTPLLGICVGMQLLFEGSEESPGVEGLGILQGTFKRFSREVITPHMGWNSLSFTRSSKLFDGIHEGADVYFVHSYYLDTTTAQSIVATTEYDGVFGVAIEKDKIYATQFHPEKSGEVGLQILRNFGGL